MSDFENNNNDQNGMNDQNPNNKIPEYSFWAEQTPNASYYNQNPNYNQNTNPNSNYNVNPNPSYNSSPNSNNNVNTNPNYNANPNPNYNPNLNPNYNPNQNPYMNPYMNPNSNPNSNPNYDPNMNQNAWNYVNNSNKDLYYSYQNGQNNPNSKKAPKKKKPIKENSKGRKVFVFIAKAACFGLIAGISFVGFHKVFTLVDPNAASSILINKVINDSAGTNEYEIGYTKPGTVETVDNSVISDVTKKTIPAIVSINSTSSQATDWFGQSTQVQGSGSGIIVGKNDKELLIVTNNHVVEGTDLITVTFADGTEQKCEIKGTDATADLAVVTVDITKMSKETLNAITVAKLGNSDEVQVGEMVIAIGNALGYGQSVTVGYISAKDRKVDVSDGYDEAKSMILLQTDASINPGNSGGALLNTKGEVIGINTIKYASNEVEGMGFAIPISRATPIITELMNRIVLSEAEQGYLGIAGNDVTEDVASYYNMPVGVFVNEVSPGGAAEKAGLLQGDVITTADKIDITSITQLKDYVNSLKVGTEVTISYMRNTNGKYEKGTVTVTLGQNPNLSAVGK